MGKNVFFIFSIGLTLGIVMNCTSPSGKNESGEINMDIKQELFGKTTAGADVFLYTLTNANGMTAKIMTLGGIVTSLTAPDRKGSMEDIVLGFDELAPYLAGHPHFGALVGRYGNRIAKGRFYLDGIEYSLAKNNGNNHLHGGKIGFDKKIWTAAAIRETDGVGVKLNYLSVDREEGYPGNLSAEVTYKLTNRNELTIDYSLVSDKATPANLTHHGYFNLSSGRENILKHEVEIFADRYTVVDEELIPTGELRRVAGTPMDFLTTFAIGDRIAGVPGGYDHNYVLNQDIGVTNKLVRAARVWEPVSGRLMEVFTTEPGMQFYTGNFLDGSLTGKKGIKYAKHHGFCMETQHFPDSPNQPDFPSAILRPGEKYTSTTVYKFSSR